MQSNEQRRVIWRHPRGIYEVVEVSGIGVFGVPYSYRETVYTQDRDTRGVAHKEIQPAPPNGGRPAGGPRIPLTDKEEKEICEMYNLDAKKIKAHKKAAEYHFTQLTCPAESFSPHPCTGMDKRAAWVRDGKCPGCCHSCDKADGCEKVCGVVKQRITSAKDAETRKAERQQREDAFMKSPLAMARRYIKLALAGVGITSYEDLEGFPKRWYMDWLWHDPLGCPAPDLDDLFRLADWAGVDPFEMIAGHEPSRVWHKYTEERPPEGARVLCNLCGCAGRYGEYIYKGGKWYFPDLDDEECEANILVSAWTEVFPE